MTDDPVLRRRAPSRINAVSNARVIEMLLDGGATAIDISETTGLWLCTVRRYIHAFRKVRHPDNKQLRMVHVSSWETDPRGAYTRAVFRLGWGRDAPKPKAKVGSERMRASRARARQLRVLQALAGAAA